MTTTNYLSKEIFFDNDNKHILEEVISFGLRLGADFVEIAFLERMPIVGS